MSEALSKIGFEADFPIKENLCDLSWYGLQTLYRHEQRIAHDLRMKGFDTYLPLLREVRQWSDRKKVIEVPAFSGYLFVRQDTSLRNRVRVLETAGVLRMLGDNHAPVPVPDSEIESLQRALESNASCKRCEHLPVGTMVQVKRGVLAGVCGRLVRSNSSLRLVLSVSTMSQGISVEVGLEDVEPFPETPRPVFSRSYPATMALGV